MTAALGLRSTCRPAHFGSETQPFRLGNYPLWVAALVALAALIPATTQAARISDLVDAGVLEQAARFFQFSDPSLRYALAGSILLGICCGLMGAFLVVRRLSLMSDALSHAVLPGVALGFLWNLSKDPLAIFIGATLAGLAGAGVVQLISHHTKHKEDAALGFVLSAFFAVGICLMTMIQNLAVGGKSGLNHFLFGQAAAMGPGDVALLGFVTLIAVGGLGIFYKEFLLSSFDPGFARSAGLPSGIFHYALMLMLAFAIVASLQAVGVVLVTAMLVIPAAAAFLLTDRMGWMLVISAGFGVAAGGAGAFASFVGQGLPTGPLMVLAAAALFFLVALIAPRHGVVSRALRHSRRKSRIARENTLKAMYHILEASDFRGRGISARELATLRKEPIELAENQLRAAKRAGQVTLGAGGEAAFTDAGWRRAREIVRNHRLWELYLTNAADYAADHVHDDAELIEHVLSDDTVRALEKRLGFAPHDPHGRPIPDVVPSQRESSLD